MKNFGTFPIHGARSLTIGRKRIDATGFQRPRPNFARGQLADDREKAAVRQRRRALLFDIRFESAAHPDVEVGRGEQGLRRLWPGAGRWRESAGWCGC